MKPRGGNSHRPGAEPKPPAKPTMPVAPGSALASDNPSPDTPSSKPSARSAFFLFFKASALTLGGGVAIVPVIGRELRRRSWMTEDEFYTFFSLSQALPGPLALSTSVLVGRRLAGPMGALAGALGMLLPPTLSIMAIAALVAPISQHPMAKDFFQGAYYSVPGLSLALLYRMVAKGKNHPAVLIAACALTALFIAFPTWILPIFFGAAVLWYCGGLIWKR